MHNDKFKFRVFDKRENKYIDKDCNHYFDDATFNMSGALSLHYWCKGEYCTDVEGEYDDDRFIIEACTGQKDKNGELLYEGDIVQVLKVNGEENKTVYVYFQVVYCEKFSSYYLKSTPKIRVPQDISFHPEIYEYEKIGTIHEINLNE